MQRFGLVASAIALITVLTAPHPAHADARSSIGKAIVERRVNHLADAAVSSIQPDELQWLPRPMPAPNPRPLHRSIRLKRLSNAFNVAWHHITVLATAYVVNPADRRCFVGTRTASGTHAGLGTVAVDTRIFPFGTRFRIPGYGKGVALDRGGAIRGHHIDLAVMSCSRAFNWGARYLAVDYATP